MAEGALRLPADLRQQKSPEEPRAERIALQFERPAKPRQGDEEGRDDEPAGGEHRRQSLVEQALQRHDDPGVNRRLDAAIAERPTGCLAQLLGIVRRRGATVEKDQPEIDGQNGQYCQKRCRQADEPCGGKAPDRPVDHVGKGRQVTGQGRRRHALLPGFD